MIPRCITVKLLKISDKEKLSQVIGGESCCYKAIKAKVTSDFLPETMQAKRQWKEIFKVLKEQVTLEFFYKKSAQKWMWNTFSHIKQLKKIYQQQTSSLRQFKCRSFKQKEISDRNQNVHEKVQRTRNINCVDKYRDFCFLLFKSLKR